MSDLKRKLYAGLCICLYALASVGGIAWLFSDSHEVYAIAAIATTAMATPFLVERIKDLMQ